MANLPYSVILLAGGLGTRVRALYPDLPKPMIPARGEPFLEWVIRYWCRQGAAHMAVSVGHLAEVAERYLAGRAPEVVETVREPHPMGTGGAVRYAAQHVRSPLSDPFVVANADSLVLASMSGALARLERNPAVSGVVLGLEMEDAARYGSLDLGDGDGDRLLGFREKRPGRAVINAGVYCFRRSLLDLFPAGEPLSMETQVFPALLASGARMEVERVPAATPFLDMGTPESLAQLDAFIAGNF
jgi:D-glycero-alpha-D-manno-heptose 1-phosphate guanylyltransferase